MMYNPNNKYLGTKSNKIRREAKIIDYICRKLDSNQSIKRYLHYNTLSPLSKKAKLDNDSIVVQNDLDISLIDENIINGSFDESIISDYRSLIFIYSPNSSFNRVVGNMDVNIDILVSKKYMNQQYGDEKRDVQLAIIIADMLDEYTIVNDDDIFEDVGSIKFELVKKNTFRLSKSNDYTVLNLVFNIGIVTMRG